MTNQEAIETIKANYPPENYSMLREALDIALAMLKEQEAATIKRTKEHGFGVYGGICPKCRNWIQSAHSFCGFCRQAVKWDD
jgi:hypothetical protein